MNLDNWIGLGIVSAIVIFIILNVYGKNKDSIDAALLTMKGWFQEKKKEIEVHTHDESILSYK